MKFLHHPGIINFIERFEDAGNIYVVTEIVKGGDLFDYITKKD